MWKSDKLREFLSKKKNISLLYIIVSICILFLALYGRGETDTPPLPQTETPSLEPMLKSILEKLDGVEGVEVAVTYESGPETVAAKNKNGDSETVVTLGSGSGERLAAEKELLPRVRGVVVVAGGAERPGVAANIFACVQALTGASAHAIAVFPAKQKGRGT